MRPLLALLLLSLAVATPAFAKVYPLDKLPDDKVDKLAPVLQQGDLALIESNPDGTMKQVTLFLFCRAPAELVHDVVASPAGYGKFMGLTKSETKPLDDGGTFHSWVLDLPVSQFDAMNKYYVEPGPLGAVKVLSFHDRDEATYRWEFHPVPGGSILVQYGYTDVKRSGSFVRNFVKKQAVMEHGLAMAAQLMLASAMRREAEQRAPKPLPPLPPRGPMPSLDFLLSRGVIAITRSTPEGRFGEVSLLDRFFASASKIREILAQPGDYAKFVPGVSTAEKRRDEGGVVYTMDFAVPILTWSGKFEMRMNGGAVESFAVEGDFRGARYRWDLTVKSLKETLVSFRFAQSLGQSSLVARKLIAAVPSLEYGLNVAYGLVYLRAMRAQAEGWPK